MGIHAGIMNSNIGACEGDDLALRVVLPNAEGWSPAAIMNLQSNFNEMASIHVAIATAYQEAERLRERRSHPSYDAFFAKGLRHFIAAIRVIGSKELVRPDVSDDQLRLMRNHCVEGLQLVQVMVGLAEEFNAKQLPSRDAILKQLEECTEDLEDFVDCISAALALKEDGPSVTWEDTKRNLGL